ncbi:MAG: hypothetical protein Q8S56_09630 [Polaromonas sp.]|nr:hypothetical protein [Polaromonas sp.]
MVTNASDISDTPFGAPPRPLTEAVLQSAEEALLTNPASVETLQGGDPEPTLDHPVIRGGPASDRLARIVGEKPLQSALAALLAGALLASLLKLALRRRRR